MPTLNVSRAKSFEGRYSADPLFSELLLTSFRMLLSNTEEGIMPARRVNRGDSNIEAYFSNILN